MAETQFAPAAYVQTADLEKMEIADLEKHMDEMAEVAGNNYLRHCMAIRNQKILDREAAIWGMPTEDYIAAIQAADAPKQVERDAHAAETRHAALAKKLAAMPTDAADLPALERQLGELETAKADLRQKADEAAKTAPSKTAVINMRRRDLLMEMRNARTAKLDGAVTVGGTGHAVK